VSVYPQPFLLVPSSGLASEAIFPVSPHNLSRRQGATYRVGAGLEGPVAPLPNRHSMTRLREHREAGKPRSEGHPLPEKDHHLPIKTHHTQLQL
jgi:hypothetical protein